MTKLSLAILIVFLTIIYTPNLVIAENIPDINAVKLENINPGSPYYVFKRLEENIKLNYLIKDKNKKAKYLSEILDKRFNELVYVVKNDKKGIFENATSRYISTIGLILEKYKYIDSNLDEQTTNYVTILSQLRDLYPANSSYWLLVQYTIDTTNRLK